ncbi:uncharacterized protein LOC106381406 [Brassica napus]|uniref:uncharacterized protein LOC106381406 n=1 Tax=Brassica napus TaxID=3708 RepID=UPI0006AAADFD|nr:uncharacterized protein LOC106381406 [Brassica napus]
MRNEYLKIVHELLLHNPYNGFYPPIKAPSRFNVEVPMFIHKMRRWGLAHAHLDDVLAHIKETLYCYPWMKSEPVTNLLNFAGDVYYIYKGKYFKAFITIYLPESYPNDPPQAWVVCEDGTTAIDPVLPMVASVFHIYGIGMARVPRFYNLSCICPLNLLHSHLPSPLMLASIYLLIRGSY